MPRASSGGFMVLILWWLSGMPGTAPQPAHAEDGLIAHIRMSAEPQDLSPSRLRIKVHGTPRQFVEKAEQTAPFLRFNGRTDFLQIDAPSPLHQLGTGDATWVIRASVATADDDLPGEILSQFDPATRTGYRWGIDTRSGVTSSQASWKQLHFGIDHGSTGEWRDDDRPGNALLIFSLAVHDGQLFAGTCEAETDGAGHVFRFDGKTWTDCGSPAQANSITSLAVFSGQLYAATGKYRLKGSALVESENPHLGGAVYRYDADARWTFCGQLPETEAISTLVVFRDKLYASSLYKPAGFFRYDGGEKWTSCGVPDGKRVESLAVYNGAIYATGYDEGAIYRYDGESWSRVGLLPEATQTYGFAVYGGELYVSEWPHALVYKYKGGTEWESVGRLGQEKESMPLAVYNGKLYGGSLPLAEVYRYDGGLDWTRLIQLDRTPDVMYRRVWSMAVYQGRLFAGTLPSGHVYSVEYGRNVTHDQPLPSGWRHLAVVKQGGQLRMYVDGDLVATSTEFDPAQFDLSQQAPVRIGFGTSDYFQGDLSDLRIYNRALNMDEIRKLRSSAVGQ